MDQSGLLHGYLLNGIGGAKSLDWDGIRAWQPEHGVLWILLDYSEEAVRDWLLNESGLEEVVANALLAEDTRPRSEAHAGGVLMSLRGINHNPREDKEDMVAIRIFANEEKVVSTRRRELLSASDVVARLRRGIGPCDSGEVVVELCESLTARMSEAIGDVEERVDTFEEHLLEATAPSTRSGLLSLRRQAIVLRRYLGPQREALQRLQAERGNWLKPEYRLRIRESADRVTRYVEDLDAARDRASVAYEELSSRQAEQLNSRMYLLSVITGVFLPLGLLTGLLGINVGGIPGAENPWGFLIVVFLLVLLIIGELIYFRHRRWW